MINIDYPLQTEDYVHRIGRTGRAGAGGTAYTFFTRENSRHAPKLIEVLKESNQFVSDGLANMGRNQGYRGSARPANGRKSLKEFLIFNFRNYLSPKNGGKIEEKQTSSLKFNFKSFGGSFVVCS